jgi:hypothetical protein
MDIPKLNLPEFEFRFKKQNNKLFIFDTFRKKYILLTPEEWVRQNVLEFLVQHKNYPRQWIAVEKEININGLKRRYDALIYNQNEDLNLLIEFKAPKVKIDIKVFEQIAAYNYLLVAPNLLISNGMEHFFAQINLENKSFSFLEEIPNY